MIMRSQEIELLGILKGVTIFEAGVLILCTKW